MANASKKAGEAPSPTGGPPAAESREEAPPAPQEAAPRRKAGRKMRRLEGVKYVRISPAIPEDLKIEMDVAIKTRFRDKHPTIDTFVEQAVREFLGKPGPEGREKI
jgi:hypothetical protein